MIMNKPELIYTTYIRTTPEKLWNAITNPEFARQYWGGNENVSDWKPGSKWMHVTGDNERAIRVTGKVVESVPMKPLVLTWPIRPTKPTFPASRFRSSPLTTLC